MEIVQALLDFMWVLLRGLSSVVRPYLSEIGLAMAATLLVVYGQEITDFLKQKMTSLGFVLKITIFVLFCALGFGLIMSYLTPFIVRSLAQIPEEWLGIIVIALFYGIGYLAKRKGMI